MEDKHQEIFEIAVKRSVQSVKCATALARQDVNFSKTLSQDVSRHLDDSSIRTLNLAEDLLRLEPRNNALTTTSKGISTKNEWKSYSELLDNVFEIVEQMFEGLNKGHATQKNSQNLTYLDNQSFETTSGAIFHSRITKPQEQFKTKVDNSETRPFKPLLRSKPHSLVSYNESCKLIPQASTENGIEPEHFPQPYQPEIDAQPYPEKLFEILTPAEPQDWVKTLAIWVDTMDDLEKMISDLSKLTEIAVDLEHHDYRSYLGIVCLMQISNRTHDWIIDTLKLRNELLSLNEVFTNPAIVKVFHGAFMDIIWLQRDLGLYVVSLFDTYHASKKLGYPRFSLAYLLENLANFKTSKKYQLADWRARPLSQPMLSYARSDTHFLLYIFDQLKNQLLKDGDKKMREVLYESRQVAKRRFEYTKFRPLKASGSKVSCPVMAANPGEPYASIMNQFNLPLHTKSIVAALYYWRDDVAKRFDELVRYVMPNQLLVNLSLITLPTDELQILKTPFITDLVRENVKSLVELLNSVIQKVSDSDWAIVDKWNLKSYAGGEGTEIVRDVNEIASLFESAISGNANKLIESHDFMAESRLLGGNQANKTIAVSFNTSTKGHKCLSAYEFLARYSAILAAMLELPPIVEVNEEFSQPMAENPVPKAADNKVSPIKQKNSRMLFTGDDEIVSLRKHTPRRAVKLDTPAETDVLDYSGPSMLQSESRENARKPKRSFDPQATEDKGPQALRRSKKINSGKLVTFKLSRR